MPKTPDYFHGKTILITGAASGIGRATALIFAREGANVVCADINETGVKETAEKINAIGSQALALTIDVTKRAAVNDMVELAVNGFGRIDFLFNSAGAALKRAKFLEIDDDLLERTFDLNFKGTWYAVQAVLPHMLKNKAGVIVNVASMAAKRGGPNTSIHYAAAKGAVNSMTLGVAREHAKDGIRCLSISPGPDQDAVPGLGEHLARDHEALSRRYSDGQVRRGRGDRRTCTFHVLRCLPVHDGGYGVREWRRRLAITE